MKNLNKINFKDHAQLTANVVSHLLDTNHERYTADESNSSNVKPFVKCHCLVGRESELKILERTFHQVDISQISEVVMIHGPSGIGKTSLVDAFLRDIPNTVLVARGKFDQIHCRLPFSALIAICEDLCRKILEHANRYEIQDRIKNEIGSEISLLENLIPELTKLNSSSSNSNQEFLTIHETNRSYNGRFKQLLRSFLRCVASKKNPIVLFFDDLHWADSTSLDILESIVNDKLSQNLLLIGAYRDDEVSNELSKTFFLNLGHSTEVVTPIEEGRKNESRSFRFNDVSISRLNKTEMNQMISTILKMVASEAESLSNLIWSKTDGNPFYACNFLDMLHTNGMLLQKNNQGWTWDEERIRMQTNVAENLARVLESKLNRIPIQVLSVLQIASFIGHGFSTQVLSMILFQEQDLVEGDFTFNRHSMEVIQKQMDSVLKLASEEGLLEATIDSKIYKFAHDKIREVLYEDLMPDLLERQHLHRRIGHLIWEYLKSGHAFQESDEWSIFLAANNVNNALTLIDDSYERYETVSINLSAGKAAVAKLDFSLASVYLCTALDLLESYVSWEFHYELCIDLYSTAAEVEKINSRYDRSDELVKEILKRAKLVQHQYAAYEIQLNCLASKGEIKASVFFGFEILRKLGVKFPRKFTLITILKEFLITKFALGTRPLASILHLPELKDQKLIYILSFMDSILVNAFLLGDSFKEIFAYFSLRTLQLTLKHGLSALYAPMAVLSWGSFHAAMGAFDKALEAEQVAFQIIEKLNAQCIKGRAILTSHATIHFWRHMLNEFSSDQVWLGYHLAMLHGDVLFAKFGLVGWVVAKTYSDEPLSIINHRIRALVEEMKEEKANRALIMILPDWQFVLNICGDSENVDPSSLRGEAMDDSFVLEAQSIDSKIALFRLRQKEMMASYLFQNWEVVSSSLSFILRNHKDVAGAFPLDFCYVWAAICSYELFLETGNNKFKREGRSAHHKIKKWADSGTRILEAPNLLLSAFESLCIQHVSSEEIVTKFNNAIQSCETSRYALFTALGRERLAKYLCKECSDCSQGMECLKNATETYRNWGALKKARYLQSYELPPENA